MSMGADLLGSRERELKIIALIQSARAVYDRTIVLGTEYLSIRHPALLDALQMLKVDLEELKS